MNITGTWMSKFSFALPLFVTRENKYTVGALMFAFATAIYLTTNHFPLFQPQLLPMTWVDQAIPFMPNTLWVYVSEYIFFAVVFILIRDMTTLNKFVYSFTALQLVSVLIFWVWPTTFPRGSFPLAGDLNAATQAVFTWLRQMDTPNNCAPSLHVSSVYLCSFLFLDEQRKKFAWIFVWATLIAISTLTTKQHYLVDVVTGFFLGAISWSVFHRWMAYVPAPRSGSKRSGSKSPRS